MAPRTAPKDPASVDLKELILKNQEALGKRLREKRVAAKLTQEQAAAASGVSVPTINRIEQGRSNVTLATLTRLAQAYGQGTIENFFHGWKGPPAQGPTAATCNPAGLAPRVRLADGE